MRFALTTSPALQPEEQLRYAKPRVRTLFCKSFPSIRYTGSLPPLSDFGTYVTDQRIVIVGKILFVVTEFNIWYAPHGKEDVLQSIRAAEDGSSVEIVTEAPGRFILRSNRALIRLYMRDASAFVAAVEMTGEAP